MALPTEGPLALSLDIRTEELVKNSSLPSTDVSTREISESAGFDEPDAFSEFYGYSSAILPTMSSIRVSGGPNDNYMAFAATPATNGFVPIISRGFYFGTDSRGPQYNTRYQVDTSNSLGEFSRGFGSLSASRTYYCWGYVQNQIGEGYTSRGAATTLPAVPISDATSTYSGYWGITSYDQIWEQNGNVVNPYGWGSRSVAKYYLHPYYGWTSIGSNGSFPTNYSHGIGRNFGYGKKANNTHTQQRNQWSTYYYSETGWGGNDYAQLPYYFDPNGYYQSNSSGSTSQGTSGNGQIVQLQNPYQNYGWNRPNPGGAWYYPYTTYSPDASRRGPASAVVVQENWEWNGYGYGN